MSKIIHEKRTPLISIGHKLKPTPHLHAAIELIYMKEGHSTAYCGKNKYELVEGSIFCAFPNQVHFYKDDPNLQQHEHYAIIVSPEQIPAFREIFFKMVPENPICIPNDPILIELMAILSNENTYIKSHFVEGMLTAIFSRLLPHYTLIKSTTPSDRTSQILLYCNEHFRENISGETVAAALYLSRGHISTIFTKTLGITFTDYINTLRLEETLRVIRNNNLCIAKAAAIAGFPTTRTFNRAFSKKYGIPPKEYLKEQKP